MNISEQTNLIKESIRMGYNDLGDFQYARGDLQQAFKCYVRTRDYCTTSKHIIAMCLNVILVSIELGQFVHVSNYVSKAELTPDLNDPVISAKLKCAAGLAHLENRKFKLAARKVKCMSVVNLIYSCYNRCKPGASCSLASRIDIFLRYLKKDDCCGALSACWVLYET